MSSVNLKELSGLVSFAAVLYVLFVSRIPKLYSDSVHIRC